MLHFLDNTKIDASNHLSEVKFVIDKLNENLKKYCDPIEMLCIQQVNNTILWMDYI